MSDEDRAKNILSDFYPNASIKAWAQYKDLYLFRVEHPLPGEEDWDPFFSVNVNTGEVRDFSVLEDLATVANLIWTDI